MKALLWCSAFVVAIAMPFAYHVVYDRAKRAYGGQKMTRSRAMSQIDNRTVFLLPDSEFLPETTDEEK